MKTLKELYALWDELGDIAVDSNDLLRSPFQHFPTGSSVYDVWYWFEEQHPRFVVGDVQRGIRPTDESAEEI